MSENPLTPRAAKLLEVARGIEPAPVDVEKGFSDLLMRERGAKLIELTKQIPPRPVDVGSGWDGVIERVARPRVRFAPLFWGGAAAAALVLAWVSMQQPPPPKPAPVVANVTPEPAPSEPAMCVETVCPTTPPPQVVVAEVKPAPQPVRPKAAVPQVEPLTPAPLVEAEVPPRPQPPERIAAADDAEWSASAPDTLKVERGKVEVLPRDERYTLVTPDVSIAGTQARYLADVTSGGTSVRVFEGEVEAFNTLTRQYVTLRAGEERYFAPQNAPSALDIVPPAVSSPLCARHTLEQRVACLSAEARGEGLKAQAALYEQAYLQSRAGRPAGAELTLRESLRRFPRGVLNPEVRIALFKALLAQRRFGEAAEAGRDFVAENPDDPRVAEVEMTIRNAEWVESR
jgi:hypothetical protein